MYLNQVNALMESNPGLYQAYHLSEAVDAIGVHPYIDPIAPGTTGHQNILDFMYAFWNAFHKPLFITEFGWGIKTPELNDGQEFNEVRQSENLVNAFTEIDDYRSRGRVVAATWFTLKDFGVPEKNYGLYDQAANERPALTGYLTGYCPPPPPAGASSAPVDATAIDVTWQPSAGATGYKVNDGSVDVDVPSTAGFAATSSYRWPGIAPGTEECFTVRAYNSYGRSMPVTGGCARTFAPPAAPSGVTAVAVNGTSVTVGWTDDSDNEDKFVVGIPGASVDRPAGSTSHTWTGLTPGSTTCFSVSSQNSYGSSAPAGPVCATTPPLPAAPSNPTAVPCNGTTITVTWADNSSNEAGFQIESNSTLLDVAANTTSYQWAGLANGTTRCFWVRSWSIAGYSAWTPSVCATTPTIPAPITNITATVYNGTTITVGWTDNSSNESGFQIESNSAIVYVAANTTSYQWGGLPNGTTRCFRVRSYNTAGSSAWSPSLCATTAYIPPVPTNIVAIPINTSQLRVTWYDNSTNESGFQVEAGPTLFYVAANTTAFYRTGLGSRQQICFRVRSYNTAGFSAWSTYACATTY